MKQKAANGDLEERRAKLAAKGFDEAQIATILATLHPEAPAPAAQSARASRKSAISQGPGAAAADRSIAIGGDLQGDLIVGGSGASRKPTAKDLEAAYLRRIVEEVSGLSLSGVDPAVPTSDPRERLRLEAVYTGLETKSQATDRPENERLELGRRQLSAIEMLDRQPRLVLLGDPGSGKSTFVHFVALCQAEGLLGLPAAHREVLTTPLPGRKEPQPWAHAELLPVRVILRDFAAEGLPAEGKEANAGHLWRFIVKTLEKATLADYASLLKKRLLAKGGLILLDGLDEVPRAQKRREQIRRAVEDFVRTFGKCRYLVTSRTYAYRNQGWLLEGFEEAELAPFGPEQVARFVDRWYAHMAALGRVEAKDAEGKATLLRQAIERSDRLSGLAERPLLLTLMASLHAWRGGSLPERREELYADAVKLLLDVWERQRYRRNADGEFLLEQPSLAAWLATDQAAVRRVLEDLAFEAHSAQPDLAGTADLAEERLVGRLLRLAKREGVSSEALIDYLRERSGLLVARGEGVYTLPHRSFQEYLAACRLTRSTYPKEVADLARADPDRWREVLLLAAAKAAGGASSTLWSLSERLCFREPEAADVTPEDAWGAHLAGLALVESGVLREVDEPYRGRCDLLRRWHLRLIRDESLPPAERAAAGKTLAALGDPRFDAERWFLPKESMLGFVEIPAGKFSMGSDPARDDQAYSDERPAHGVDLSTFFMARWPVTVAQFGGFVAATGHEGVRKEFLGRPGNEPVVGVSWHDALAYAGWLGAQLQEEAARRKEASGWGETAGEVAFWQGLASGDLSVSLPSEAEWEKSARGADGRIYPWEGAYDKGRANDGEAGIGRPSAVGCFPGGASLYGVEELSGNVWEWTRSEYRPYPYEAIDGRENLGDSDASRRVLRGGAFYNEPRNVRCAVRYWNVPVNRDDFIGFRVVVSPFRSGL